MQVYFNNGFVEEEKVRISPFDRGFQFADGIYEVIRYYPDQFFELDAHLLRLKSGLKELDISFSNTENINEILYELIERNNLPGKTAIAYLQITRGSQYPRKHSYNNESITPTFIAYVEELPINFEAMNNGVKIETEPDIRWHRCDIKTIALLPNVLSKQRAVQKNLFEIVWHRNGIITEGVQTNVAFVRDSIVHNPVLNNLILPGITRQTVLRLCASLGIKTTERDVHLDELKQFDEIFLMSTTAEITPVVKIDNIIVGNGVPGKLTKFLQQEFKKLCSEK